VGTTVSWTQEDVLPPTTTSGTSGLFDGMGWDSPWLNQEESFSHTFSQAGTFLYTCRIHPTMSGTVTVADGSGGGSTSTTGESSSGDSDYNYQ
jgi:plastocyanin